MLKIPADVVQSRFGYIEELRRAGVVFESKTAFRDFLATHVTIDNEQRFVTGQNQNSGLEAAHTMMGIIDKRT